MKLTIPGNPIAQMRPRFRRVGAHVMTYDPQKYEKENVKNNILYHLGFKASDLPFKTTLAVNVTFFIPICDSSTLTHRNAKLWQLDDNHKPDIDNLLKACFDIGNKVLWHDDCQITSITAKKQYSDNPRTEIEIMEVYMPKHITDILKCMSPTETQMLLHDCNELAHYRDLPAEGMEDMANLLHAFAKKHIKTLSKLSKIKHTPEKGDEYAM